MRIFNGSAGDPMLLDREAGLRSLSARIRSFLQNSSQACIFEAETDGNPAPYSEFLSGWRVEKVNSGDPVAWISDNRHLELKATVADLEDLCLRLEKTAEGGHTHFNASPVSLVFEADSSWPGFHEG
jgi:hypothetical protein